MNVVSRWIALAAVSAFAVFPLANTVHADAASALRCQRTINKELAKFVKTKTKILQKCKNGAVTKAAPASPVDCPLTPQDDKINAAAQKMRDKIAAKCGGANKLCNTADLGENADEPLAAIGWNIGTCPDLHGEGCVNAINDCNDIGTCLTCIGHKAVNQSTELYYDLLTAAEFGTGSALNDCQARIGKATAKFLETKSKLLHKCWDKVLQGKAGYASPLGCPDTDPSVPNQTIVKIAEAEQKKIAKICEACGAGGDADGDNVCDAPLSAFTPGAIGFEPDCPDATVPGSASSCVRTVSTLGDLIACVDCITEFDVDCSTALAVPALTTYPAECSAVPTP